MQQSLLRPQKLAEYIGTSLRTVYRLDEKDPTFPSKIVLTTRCVGWRKADVDAWLQAKVEGV